jgi:glucose-6-phosphate 1-dehydrogenase
MITSSVDLPQAPREVIEQQITMAKEKLMSESQNIPPDLYQTIMEELSKGHVLPAFHAVIMGKPYGALRGSVNDMWPQREKAEPGHHDNLLNHMK